jgi:DNA-binding Lrp family transcriptional regulator
MTPTREDYTTVIREILRPYLSSPQDAWKGIYEALLWFEHGVPHIIDANYLKQGAWRTRAERVQEELADRLRCSASELPSRVDRLLRSALFPEPTQRQNPLGVGFVTALFQVLECFSSSRYEFRSEEDIGTTVFPGISEAPRSRPDVVVVSDSKEVAVISAKWSLRHDRLKDLSDECDYFKRLRPSLRFYAVTNEFNPARLRKVLQSYCIDALFHVCRPLLFVAVDDAGHPDLLKVKDLTDLLAEFSS